MDRSRARNWTIRKVGGGVEGFGVDSGRIEVLSLIDIYIFSCFLIFFLRLKLSFVK